MQADLRNKVSMICFLPVSWSTDSRSILSATASRSVIQQQKIEKLAWFFLEIPFQFILLSCISHLLYFLFLSFSLIISYYYLVSYEFQVNALTTQYWLLARNLLLLCPLSNTAHEIVFFLEIVANVSFVLLKGMWLL